MKPVYADLLNNILQQYYFAAENSGNANAWDLGMALAAVKFVANYAGDIDVEIKIAEMINDCKKGIVPQPAYSDISSAKARFF